MSYDNYPSSTSPSAIPPGWYYADGDPPGTQRYWDGTQWIGGPVLGGVPAVATSTNPAAQRTDRADYGQRVGGFLVDTLVYFGPLIVVVAASELFAEAVGAIIVLFALAASIGNTVILQGLTGQSVGKRVVGIKVVRVQSDGVPGIGIMLVRAILPALFSFVSCYLYLVLDLLWPLWDSADQRITDKIVSTVVVRA